MSLHGLSFECGDMPSTLQCLYKYFSQSCEKLTDAIKHSDVSGTSELFIIHFKWRGITVQSAPLFASTRTPYLHEFLDVCISSTLCLLLSYCDMDKRLFGKEKSKSGVAEALALVRQIDYLCKACTEKLET